MARENQLLARRFVDHTRWDVVSGSEEFDDAWDRLAEELPIGKLVPADFELVGRFLEGDQALFAFKHLPTRKYLYVGADTGHAYDQGVTWPE